MFAVKVDGILNMRDKEYRVKFMPCTTCNDKQKTFVIPTPAQVMTGIKALATLPFNNSVSPDVVKKRQDICLKCEHLTKLYQCSQCGCFIKAKTISNKEQCPLNPPRW